MYQLRGETRKRPPPPPAKIFTINAMPTSSNQDNIIVKIFAGGPLNRFCSDNWNRQVPVSMVVDFMVMWFSIR